MKTIKTSTLIGQKEIAHSITVSPDSGGYKIRYCLKEKNKKGFGRIKTIKVDNIIEDAEIPKISNWTVEHLGYKTYKYYQIEDFYINFYQLT